MAIGNILKENTYSYIDQVFVNKNNKTFSFKFHVYENNLKEKLILEKYYTFSCQGNACKVVDQVYTSKDFTSNLTDIYYNNPSDLENKPGIYSVNIREIEQLDEDGKTTKKQEIYLNKNYNYNFIYLNDKYYKFQDSVIEFNGLITEHFFDNVIHPSINKNIIQVLYGVLLKEEESYQNYPEV